jgi:putative NADH-flavin reductase
VAGDVLDAHAVAAAVPGHDAVISALGHSRPSLAGRDLHPGASHIIEAMKAAGVSRQSRLYGRDSLCTSSRMPARHHTTSSPGGICQSWVLAG